MGHKEHPKGWPSVTQAIGVVDKPFLFYWAAKNGLEFCERVKRESGALGQRIHDAIAGLLTGQDVSLENEKEHVMVQTFVEWQEREGFKALEVERSVTSEEFSYHGTLDAIGTFGSDPDLYVLDWKTSSKIDEMYGVQLAAYAKAYTEETSRPIKGGRIVRLDKKDGPPIEEKRFDNLDRYFMVFEACLVIWNFLHTKKKKAA
jgi:hypothetical protein